MEVGILRSLYHKNIVGYLGACMNDGMVYIFMEYISGGSIQNILKRYIVHPLQQGDMCLTAPPPPPPPSSSPPPPPAPPPAARFGPLSERCICNYTKQILKALHYLHYNRIIHRWAWSEPTAGAYSSINISLR